MEGSHYELKVLWNKINPTDEVRTRHVTLRKIAATTSAHFGDRTSAQFKSNIGVKAVLHLLLFSNDLCSVFAQTEFICISSRNGRLKTFMCELLSLLSHDQLD